MPKPLCLFEHQTKGFSWNDRDLYLVDRLNSLVGMEVLRLTFRREKLIQAFQHVGVIQFGNRTVQILPKVYQSSETQSDDVKTKEATINLLRMLAYANKLSLREHELAPLMQQTDNWFEFLTRLFATHLRQEWQRGAFRNYQTFDDELPILKGKWRISEQLKRPIHRDNFFVSYDEFTADNPLNRVFRFVTEKLWNLTRDGDNRQFLGELRQWMEVVTLLSHATRADANLSQLTRLNAHYEPLLNLAGMFLDGGALQLTAGDLTTFAFVFDMNQLFEEFIAGFIRRHYSEILPENLQAADMLMQSTGEKRFLAKKEGRNVFQTKPDIVFRNYRDIPAKHSTPSLQQFPLLVDTKYKRLNAADQRLGVSQSDFYQMLSYAHRYNCPHVILLYPQTADIPSPLNQSFRLADRDTVIRAATVNLQINLARKDQRQLLVNELRKMFMEGPL